MSTTVGIFEDQAAAEATINRLDALGVDEGDIHVLSRRGMERGGTSLVGVVARAFRAGDGPVSNELTRLGLEREEAAFYDQELDEDSLLLVVQADDDHADEVLAIMRDSDGTMHER